MAVYPGSHSAPGPDSADVRPGRAVHVVKPGETLGSIAALHGADPAVLHMMNRHTLAGDAVVHPGMRLEILCPGIR